MAVGKYAHTFVGQAFFLAVREFLPQGAVSDIVKGIFMKLKIVAFAISVEKLIYKIFYDVLLLSYKPSNFAWAILPHAAR